MQMLNRGVLMVVVALMLVVSACENPKTRAAMTLDDNGNPVAIIKPCHADTTVFGLSIKRFSDNSMIWEITSATGTPQWSFPLGQLPPGFKEVVAYNPRPLEGDVQVDFKTSELPHDSANIDMSQLQRGTVLLNGKQVTMTAFNNRDVCH